MQRRLRVASELNVIFFIYHVVFFSHRPLKQWYGPWVQKQEN